MMEAFGDRIAKISQIDRRAWINGLPLSTVIVVVVVVVVVAAAQPPSFRTNYIPHGVPLTNIRFVRNA